jgi:CHASE2 domain-containing sensor protein
MLYKNANDKTAVLLILVCMALVISFTGIFSRLENILYDTAQRWYPRAVPEDIVLVTIDEQSLYQLGRWPWTRRHHADLVDKLHAAGALVIGLDIIFAESQRDDPEADKLLAQSIERAGNVVLPVLIERVASNGQLIETLPLSNFSKHAAGLGRVHAEIDADSIARGIVMWEGLGAPVWPHFAQVMITVAGELPGHLTYRAPQVMSNSETHLVKHERVNINFSTAQRKPLSISYEQVLSGSYAADIFRGKWVLVGATASGMADSLSTPVSGLQQPMPGVEFLANVLISMRANTLVNFLPMSVGVFIACFFGALPIIWLPRVSSRTGLVLNTVYFALLVMVVMAMPVLFNIWVPISGALVAVLGAYPIWAWRKLESASYFLQQELDRVHQALVQQGANGERTRTPKSVVYNRDFFQDRIEQVAIATERLKNIEEQQRETLAFISHDIRVPLASAVQQIKSTSGVQDPLYQQLSRALSWAEDFLQTSHAQMIDVHAFVEIDLIALLHEVSDEVYPLIQAKKLTFIREFPEHPVWVMGQSDMLMRTVANLITNAIKFSPEKGVIGLLVCLDINRVQIQVTDEGPGIPVTEQDRLFRRFSRIDPNPNSTSSGIGLGLYFVQITIQKHQGSVHVNSRPGKTTFGFDIPMSK